MSSIQQRVFSPRVVIQPEGEEKSWQDIVRDVISFEYVSPSRGMARVTLVVANPGLKYANDSRFKEGFRFKMRFGYPGMYSEEKKLVVVGAAPTFPNGLPVITLTGYDKGRVMVTSRPKNWGRLSSSEIATKIASIYGLRSNVDQSKDWRPRARVQPANVSSFEYLDRLAQEIGYDFWIEKDTLCFKILDFGQTPVGRFTYYKNGGSILKEFSPSVRQAAPPTTPRANTNHEGTQESHATPTATGPRPAQDLTRFRTDFETTGTNSERYRAADGPTHATAETHPAAQRRQAAAEQLRLEMRANTATAEFVGWPLLMARKIIQIDVTEVRYSGLWRIEEATHSITSDGGYTTTVSLSRGGTNRRNRHEAPRNNQNNQTNNQARVETRVLSDYETTAIRRETTVETHSAGEVPAGRAHSE